MFLYISLSLINSALHIISLFQANAALFLLGAVRSHRVSSFIDSVDTLAAAVSNQEWLITKPRFVKCSYGGYRKHAATPLYKTFGFAVFQTKEQTRK